MTHTPEPRRKYGRLTVERCIEIRQRYDRSDPLNNREGLAREFGVSVRTITNALQGRYHKDLRFDQ